jgi:hypothetical protein
VSHHVRSPTTPPYFLESRENAPSLLTPEAQAACKKYAHSVLKAFGFNKGCFHVELMSTKVGMIVCDLSETCAFSGQGSLYWP